MIYTVGGDTRIDVLRTTRLKILHVLIAVGEFATRAFTSFQEKLIFYIVHIVNS